MKKLYPVLIMVCVACCSEPMPPSESVIAAFNTEAQTAEWLHQYSIAGKLAYFDCMQSAKDILQKPGFLWFGFKENTLWHFVFGYLEDRAFSVKFHYTVDSTLHLERNNLSIPPVFTHPYIRALLITKSLIAARNKPADSFSYYVKRNTDSSMLVWAVSPLPDKPATQCSGYNYTFDKSGSIPAGNNEYHSFDNVSTDTPERLKITYSHIQQPPWTAIFYALEYSNKFRQIIIETSTLKSILHNEDGCKWIHCVR